ncbi:TrmH family RNA methyltransferase [Aquimarina brevivitae]|uniref:tRNA (guanosine(18)-2'-O)-methyltransferase n=1 Tax=Aquimarina brevivitae TaxID=323412 RepID=A0A4Q7P489_9FLAO|nr:RNA methyltransferase [Aquimarina brevivitae]RZS93512.1 tRNA (guanosine-2'-O-)-methyltransferase [Aquimarina brevivitae]
MIDLELLAYLEACMTDRRKELYKSVLKERTNHFTVAIEDVYQLHNTSAVIRSCDVFGIQNVHVIEEINAKRIDREIAMGAQKWVDINRHATTKVCIKTLRNKGYQIIATTPHNDSVTLADFDVSKPAAFFFGQEQKGLSDQVFDQADGLIHIPMVGFTESLNISVSAAIILQSVTSKLKRSEIAWQLSEEEVLAKRLDWVKKSVKSYDQVVARFYTLQQQKQNKD